jgi:cytoskeletal protein RodZ
MTNRTNGLALGRFTAGFIGLVAMAALVTGAVAAANAPAALTVADATASATASAGESTGASSSATLEATENPSIEASEHPSKAPESSAVASAEASAKVSCDPTLDLKEDAAEKLAKQQGGGQDLDGSPAPSIGAAASPTTEPSEPPTCKKVDLDGDGPNAGGKIGKIGQIVPPSANPGQKNDGNKDGGHTSFQGFRRTFSFGR